jgi:hypothetical protein
MIFGSVKYIAVGFPPAKLFLVSWSRGTHYHTIFDSTVSHATAFCDIAVLVSLVWLSHYRVCRRSSRDWMRRGAVWPVGNIQVVSEKKWWRIFQWLCAHAMKQALTPGQSRKREGVLSKSNIFFICRFYENTGKFMLLPFRDDIFMVITYGCQETGQLTQTPFAFYCRNSVATVT